MIWEIYWSELPAVGWKHQTFFQSVQEAAPSQAEELNDSHVANVSANVTSQAKEPAAPAIRRMMSIYWREREHVCVMSKAGLGGGGPVHWTFSGGPYVSACRIIDMILNQNTMHAGTLSCHVWLYADEHILTCTKKKKTKMNFIDLKSLRLV